MNVILIRLRERPIYSSKSVSTAVIEIVRRALGAVSRLSRHSGNIARGRRTGARTLGAAPRAPAHVQSATAEGGFEIANVAPPDESTLKASIHDLSIHPVNPPSQPRAQNRSRCTHGSQHAYAPSGAYERPTTFGGEWLMSKSIL